MCIISIYICVFKNLLLSGIFHENGIKLELFCASARLHVNCIFIWWLYNRVVTLWQRKKPTAENQISNRNIQIPYTTWVDEIYPGKHLIINRRLIPCQFPWSWVDEPCSILGSFLSCPPPYCNISSSRPTKKTKHESNIACIPVIEKKWITLNIGGTAGI